MAPGAVIRRFGSLPHEAHSKFWLRRSDGNADQFHRLFIVDGQDDPMVVKIERFSKVRNELFGRLVVRRYFSKWFDVPDAAAYRLRFGAVLVMRKVGGIAGDPRTSSLEPSRKVPLFLLARTLGLEDVSWQNMLLSDKKPCLLDMGEMLSRHAWTPPASRAKGKYGTDPRSWPWVCNYWLSEYGDYDAAIRNWQRVVAKGERTFKGMLARAGFSQNKRDAAWRTILRNVDLLPEIANQEIASVNFHFFEQARNAGMTRDEAEELSRINRSIGGEGDAHVVGAMLRFWSRQSQNPFVWKVLRFWLHQHPDRRPQQTRPALRRRFSPATL